MSKKPQIKSDFLKNVAILMSGNALAQLISILILPLLTYLFSPTEMGVLGTFVALTGWFGVIVTLRYDLAVMLPKEGLDADRLAKIAFRFSVIISLLFLIPIVAFNDQICSLLEPANSGDIDLKKWRAEFSLWLYLVPFSILLVGFNSTLIQWQSRRKAFKRVSAASVTQNAGNASVSTISGLLGAGSGGLISAQLVHQITSVVVLGFKSFFGIWKTPLDGKDRKRLISEYKDFPLKSGPAILLNLTASQLPIILIGMWFGAPIAGQYYVTIRILNAPLTFIGRAFSQAFFQKSNELLNKGESVAPLVKRTSVQLFAIMVLPMLALFFFGEELFDLVFADKYGEAGAIASAFSIFYLFRFVFSAQSTILTTKRKLTAEILFNALMVLSQVGGLIYGHLYNDYHLAFRIMAISGAVLFLILGGLIFKYARED